MDLVKQQALTDDQIEQLIELLQIKDIQDRGVVDRDAQSGTDLHPTSSLSPMGERLIKVET